MSWSIVSLPWLEPAPAAFRQRCRRIGIDDNAGAEIAALARTGLNANELISLGRVVQKTLAAKQSLAPLTPLSVGILGSGTTELWTSALIGSGARYGIALTLVVGDYDQALQEAVDPQSRINTANPDAVLIALDYRALRFDLLRPGDAQAAAEVLAGIQDHYRSIRDGVANNVTSTVMWQNLACPAEALFGHLDISTAGTARWFVQQLNGWIAAESASRGDLLLDVAALAERVGTDEWFDPVQWNLHKLPFSQRVVPLYADHVARLLGALRGRSRKCLVLDLDNTLWGGVIGDDGLEGIRIGQGSGEGEAFVSVQEYALRLRSRGIILAVASKNDEHNARLPFRKHPDMILREEHITVFAANWTDKATNLETIARELNLGLDALVFLDDNPAERAQVRAALPTVAVPEIPQDPSYFVRALAAAGYFESTSFVAEDAARADSYAANSQRVSLQTQSRDLNEFLKSLDMVLGVGPFDALGRARIAQLINKSNQFNLTTVRATEAEVGAMSDDPARWTLQIRLKDRFGDNGMIGVIVCRRAGERWEIEIWLMSCRVLGRRVEEVTLSEIAREARAAGAIELIGRFRPSGKNEMVRDHYAKLGFSSLRTDGDDTLWVLDLTRYVQPDLPFDVERVPQGSSKDASDAASIELPTA